MAFARLERDAWTDPGVADAYARLWSGFVAPSIPRLLDAALVEPGHHLLDVATGPGPVVRGALARGALPVALDFSAAMLAKGDRAVPRVRADAARLPFPDASFDRVVSNLGLLHFPDPDAALREAARVTRPEGVVAFAVWGPDATALTIVPESLRAIGVAPSSHGAPGFFRFGAPGAFEQAMRAAGLEPMPTERLGWSGTVPDPESFWGMFHDGSARTRASILALSPADQERLRAEVVRRVSVFRSSAGSESRRASWSARGRHP